MTVKGPAYSEQVVAIKKPLSATSSVTGIEENSAIVDSLLHPLAILIRQVLTRQGREALNLILIDDEENILQAMDAGIQLHSLFHAGGDMFSKELMRELLPRVKVHELARRTCKKLFENDKISRVFALAHAPASRRLDTLLHIRRDIVVLEDLTISGNIGAIVRTSLAFDVGGIVLLNADPVDVYDRRIIRASRGHIFSLPVVTATTEEFIRFCKQTDLPIVIMAAQADTLVNEAAAFPRQLMIVFGSEKNGCSQALTDAAMLQVQIPTHSRVESLNVSTAAGIMLYNRLWLNHPEARK